MRQKSIIAALGICAALLAADIAVRLITSPPLREAYGQEAGGDIIMAAANTQSETFIFLYNRGNKRLTSYMQRRNGGLELKGVRDTSADFPRIAEFPRGTGQTAVTNMKKLEEEIQKAEEQAKKR